MGREPEGCVKIVALVRERKSCRSEVRVDEEVGKVGIEVELWRWDGGGGVGKGWRSWSKESGVEECVKAVRWKYV